MSMYGQLLLEQSPGVDRHPPRTGGRQPRLLMVATVPICFRAFLFPYARAFAAKGWQVDAMARDVSSCSECRKVFSHLWDVPWSRNPLDPKNLLLAPSAVRRAVQSGGYDIVHVHSPVAAFVTRMAFRKLRSSRKPCLIYTAHGFHFFPGGGAVRNAIFLGLEKLASKWTDYLVVMNRDDLAEARRYHLAPESRIILMPGIGVNTNRFSPEAVPPAEVAQVRASMKLSPDTPLFLQIAEFIPRKRHSDALHAFARLKHPGAHLALAGDGPLLPSMQQLAVKLGIAEKVHFLGYRRDIPSLIRAADAVLLVSKQEGLPLSIMEALSLEVPVIGTDIRGTHELLADGGGLLVSVGCIERLSEAMDWILDHPVEAKAMGRHGRSKMQQGFDSSIIQQMHELLYAQALLNRPTSDDHSS